VLLPVHAGVAASHWRAALASLAAQTEPPFEVVVVEDGPLTPQLDEELARSVSAGLPVVRVQLPQNEGAGRANQAGLLAATGEWIAKADADDISVPDRLARQLDALRRTGADVCGAAMWEFDEDPQRPSRLRPAPLDHESIARRMRVNNPINHPTAVYRRAAALAAGGYPDWRFMQDYDLFARMLTHGSVMMNLEEPLVLFRAGDAMRRRRSARGFAAREWVLQRALHRYGLIGISRMVVNFVARMAFRMLPGPLLRLAYARVLGSPLPTAPSSGRRP
jgi:glycosyltransferase involved in cell wall biosynthesis